MAFTIVDNPEQSRYEARTDSGQVAGFSTYRRRRDSVIVFEHTEVDSAYEGQGVGSTLVRGALEQVRRRGARVRPDCPFVRGYIDRHPEYAELVTA